MAVGNRPSVWQMVKEAVADLGSPTTNVAVRDWILTHYPGTNKNTINCQIILCTVNHASRIHYGMNHKPRLATSEYDFLFRPQQGQLEWYDSDRHGLWRIYVAEDGKLAVGPADGTREGPDPGTEPEAGGAFAQESHLRDHLAQHLGQIEDGLELYADESGDNGVEFRTDVGRIDILAVGADGGLVVIELKVAKGPDAAAGQVLRYKNWVKRHLADGKPVRGILIAQHISKKLQYAIADDPELSAMEYEISLTLHGVAKP